MSAATLQQLYLPRKKPPTARDREIYELAVEERVSQADLAERFGLSQGRIAQIVQKVEDWVHTMLGQASPPVAEATEEDPEWTPGQRLRVAEQIAYERVEYVYGQAMEAWRESRQDSSEVRTRLKGISTIEERITKSQTGKPALLNQAMRAALASARLLGVDVTGREKRKSIEQASRATTNNRGETRAESTAESTAIAATCAEKEPALSGTSVRETLVAQTSPAALRATTNTREDSRVKSRGEETHDEMMDRLQATLAAGVEELLTSAAGDVSRRPAASPRANSRLTKVSGNQLAGSW